MGGKAITICGFTGTGKTTFAKQLTSGRDCLVFDVNNEYKDLEEIDPLQKWTGGRYRYTGMDFKEFLYIIQDSEGRNVVNCDIILEDCTGFMKGQAGSKALQIFQAKRHTNNNYYFIYHAVEAVPRDIYRFTNIFVLFYTNETIKQISKRFPALEAAAGWVHHKYKVSKHFKKIIQLI